MKIMQDDDRVWQKGYKRLPAGELKVPSLYMMGYAKNNSAWDPLLTHYHENLEVVVMLNGNQQYFVNGSGYTLYGGNMFITYPFEEHGNGNLPQNACEFIWFQLDMKEREDFLGLSGELAREMYRWITECKKRVMDIDPQGLKLLLKAWEGLSSSTESGRLHGYSALLNFITEYFSLDPDKNEIGNRLVTSDILQSLQFIQENLETNINIDEVAAECALSPSRFKAKFREQMGITPLYYINSLKIDRAKEMLKNDKVSIIDIAFKLDFASSNYFSTVFKKFTGYSPVEFRKRESHN